MADYHQIVTLYHYEPTGSRSSGERMNYEWGEREDLHLPLGTFQHHNSFKLDEWAIRKYPLHPPLPPPHSALSPRMLPIRAGLPAICSASGVTSAARRAGALFVVKLCIPTLKNTIKKSCHLSHWCISRPAQTRVEPLCTSLK